MSQPKYRPLGNRLLIDRTIKQDTTKGGILLPTKAQEDTTSGVVVAKGPGIVENGVFVPLEGIEVGDTVLFAKKAGEEIQVTKDEKIFLIRAGEVIAVVQS